MTGIRSGIPPAKTVLIRSLPVKRIPPVVYDGIIVSFIYPPEKGVLFQFSSAHW